MALDIKIVEYYNTKVGNHAGEGAKLLSKFADAGVSLLAFKAVPLEPTKTKYSLFPDDISKMNDGAKKVGVELDGPYSALIIKGNEDEPGDCANIFEKLSHVDITLIESNGIADIKGGYGVILYFNQEDCEKALTALKE